MIIMNDTSFPQLAQIYLIAINVITFFLYGIDKMKAQRS